MQENEAQFHTEQLNALAMSGTLEPYLKVWLSSAMLNPDVRTSIQAEKQLINEGPSGPEHFELVLQFSTIYCCCQEPQGQESFCLLLCPCPS